MNLVKCWMKGMSVKYHESTLHQRGDIFHSYGLRVMGGTVKTILLRSLVMVVNLQHLVFFYIPDLPRCQFWFCCEGCAHV